MIECKICHRKFDKLISSTHLKSHNISSKQYKDQYGSQSLASDEYRAERSKHNSGSNNPNFGNSMSQKSKETISKKNSGKIPHNKGIKVADPAHLESIRCGIEKRESKYESGELQRPEPYERTLEIRTAISNSLKKYRTDNPNAVKESAQKSLLTKIENNFDFGSPMRGKFHTDETKEQITKSIRQIGKIKRENTKKCWAKKIDGYGYDILNWDNFLTVKCRKCDLVFERTLQAFYRSKYNVEKCTFCIPSNSSEAEMDILNLVQQAYPSAHKNKSLINPKEIDIYIPEINLGIEYCGLYWHSDARGIPDTYHQSKMNDCISKNIKLITIFEDEWIHHQEIVKNKIMILTGNIDQLHVSNMVIREVEKSNVDDFLNSYDIMNDCMIHKSYGLYHDNELIAIMSFGKIENDYAKWELVTYTVKDNYSIVGGPESLFERFVHDNEPIELVSFVDSRWDDGAILHQLGFEEYLTYDPICWYFNSSDRIRTRSECQSTSNYHRIWDCGKVEFVWKK